MSNYLFIFGLFQTIENESRINLLPTLFIYRFYGFCLREIICRLYETLSIAPFYILFSCFLTGFFSRTTFYSVFTLTVPCLCVISFPKEKREQIPLLPPIIICHFLMLYIKFANRKNHKIKIPTNNKIFDMINITSPNVAKFFQPKS